jgi:hypothetical protein
MTLIVEEYKYAANDGNMKLQENRDIPIELVSVSFCPQKISYGLAWDQTQTSAYTRVY